MILRIIIWVILLFIAIKIIGIAMRYVRKIMTPNRHISTKANKGPERYTNVEDVPYEEIPKNK